MQKLPRAVLTAVSTVLVASASSFPAMSAPDVSNKAPRPQPVSTVQTPDCVPGQILVQLRKGADRNETKQVLQDVNGTIVDQTTDGNLTFALIQIDQPQKNWANALKKLVG